MISPQTFIKELAKELEKVPEIKAFILVGSQTGEISYPATEQSDIESYIVAEDEAVEKIEGLLPSLISQFGKVLFSFKHQIGFVAVYDDLSRVELPVVKLSEIESVFSRPTAQKVKIIFDRTAGDLSTVLANRPETIEFGSLFEKIVVNYWYWQILGAQYFTKGELYNARSILNIHASAFIKLFELLNDPKILLLESNKRIEKFLTIDQQAQLRRVTSSYDKVQIKNALITSMELLPQLAASIKEKYGYAYDESLEDKVKPKILQLFATQ